jgi:hypothetical protein
MSTKFAKLALGFSVIIGAVVAIAISVTRHAAAPTAQPASSKVAAAESDNPLDTATPGETPSKLADNLIATLKIKVVGQWGEFAVFDLKADLNMGSGHRLHFPITVDGNTYDDIYALATQLLPLTNNQVYAAGVNCEVVCWDPAGDVIGYSLRDYSDLAKQNNLPPIPSNQVSYVQALEKLLATPAPAAPVEEVKLVDGSTDSDVPTGVIRDAINHDDKLTQYGAYPVQTWKETNTYTRKINDEKVVFIEVRGTFHLSSENMQYLGSKGGISFSVASYERDGAVELVKRGNSWYILKG